MSLVALRTIRVRGSFAKPEVDLDKGKLTLRGLSECRKLIAEAKATTQ